MAEKCCTITSHDAPRTPEGAKRPGGEPTCFDYTKGNQGKTFYHIREYPFLFWKQKIIQQTHEKIGLTFRPGVVVNFFIYFG